MKALRDYYGEALVKYGSIHDDVVVLDADLAGSTRSGKFGAKFPERFFNVGIAEANMTGMTAGFAAVGKIPFANTFAVFLTTNGLLSARTFGSYSNLNMKLMGAYGGVSDSYDGPTHHALEDVAVMRTLPNFEVLVASDGHMVDWLIKHAIEVKKPMYIRLSREATRLVYEENEEFEVGKAKILREGNDVAIIAFGVMVERALDAAEVLKQEHNIDARVIDMWTVKPIDEQAILAAAETDAVITVEDHNIMGGLGSAVAEVLTSNYATVPQGFVGILDTHAECGPFGKLMERYCLGVDNIVLKTLETLKLKKK